MKRDLGPRREHLFLCPRIRPLLKLFSTPLTMEVLVRLSEAATDVTSLAEGLQLDQPSVSRNLRMLHDCGLVEFKRDRRRRIYGLGDGIDVEREEAIVRMIAWAADGSEIRITVPRNRI